MTDYARRERPPARPAYIRALLRHAPRQDTSRRRWSLACAAQLIDDQLATLDQRRRRTPCPHRRRHLTQMRHTWQRHRGSVDTLLRAIPGHEAAAGPR
jgi:hypothetical protein